MAKPSNKKAQLTREALNSHIEDFLKKGGEIDKVPSGITGIQATKGPKHITITPSGS